MLKNRNLWHTYAYNATFYYVRIFRSQSFVKIVHTGSYRPETRYTWKFENCFVLVFLFSIWIITSLQRSTTETICWNFTLGWIFNFFFLVRGEINKLQRRTEKNKLTDREISYILFGFIRWKILKIIMPDKNVT